MGSLCFETGGTSGDHLIHSHGQLEHVAWSHVHAVQDLHVCILPWKHGLCQGLWCVGVSAPVAAGDWAWWLITTVAEHVCRESFWPSCCICLLWSRPDAYMGLFLGLVQRVPDPYWSGVSWNKSSELPLIRNNWQTLLKASRACWLALPGTGKRCEVPQKLPRNPLMIPEVCRRLKASRNGAQKLLHKLLHASCALCRKHMQVSKVKILNTF